LQLLLLLLLQVRPMMHEVVCAAVPVIDQLRSSCVKNAVMLLQVGGAVSCSPHAARSYVSHQGLLSPPCCLTLWAGCMVLPQYWQLL
jgi:hypothetical protein